VRFELAKPFRLKLQSGIQPALAGFARVGASPFP
jgi:hypothetical protein